MEPKKFTQEEETLIVQNAMQLTATILFEDLELKKTEAEEFRPKPNEPKRKVLAKPTPTAPQYPAKPKTTYQYSDYVKTLITPIKEKILSLKKIVLILLAIIAVITLPFTICILVACIWPALVITFYLYLKKRKELNIELSKSPDYLKAIEEAEKKAAEQDAKALEEMQKKQEELDKLYEQQKNEYDTVTIPQYTTELIAWTTIRDRKIAFLQEEIKYNTEALNDLYDNSRIISARYRELWILKWLYDDMSTSDHDIRYATELLDRERQLEATREVASRAEAAIYEMGSTLTGSLNNIYDAIEQGNSLQEDSINILSKTRRDTNISNIVGIAQRHNTNKMLKSITGK